MTTAPNLTFSPLPFSPLPFPLLPAPPLPLPLPLPSQTECMSQTLFDLVAEDDLKAVEEELEGYKEQARDAGTYVRMYVGGSVICRGSTALPSQSAHSLHIHTPFPSLPSLPLPPPPLPSPTFPSLPLPSLHLPSPPLPSLLLQARMFTAVSSAG